jgi:hypothetical protein
MDKYLRCGNNINAFNHMVMNLLCGNDTIIQYMANFLWCGKNTNVLKCMERMYYLLKTLSSSAWQFFYDITTLIILSLW